MLIRGSFVRKIEIKKIIEIYDIRSALNALAGDAAIANINESDLEILSSFVRNMTIYAKQNNVASYFKENLKFHFKIIEITGNETLLSIYETITKKTFLYRTTSLSLPGRLKISLDQHLAILKCLENKDGRSLVKLLKKHINDSIKALIRPNLKV